MSKVCGFLVLRGGRAWGFRALVFMLAGLGFEMWFWQGFDFLEFQVRVM